MSRKLDLLYLSHPFGKVSVDIISARGSSVYKPFVDLSRGLSKLARVGKGQASCFHRSSLEKVIVAEIGAPVSSSLELIRFLALLPPLIRAVLRTLYLTQIHHCIDQ